MADWLESFLSMKQRAYIRLGKWDGITAQNLPADPELYCVTTAMMHYAKAVAYAASGNVPDAEREAGAFEAACARVPDSRTLFNNTCQAILDVGREMMLGEIAYRKADDDAAFAHLRRSVALDDALPYDEPWGWTPPCHAPASTRTTSGHCMATRLPDTPGAKRGSGFEQTTAGSDQCPR
ncbi:MAG TPA: hypothetical protein ENK28_04160 [Aliiroseovarius sp.]|nr:hypothetical protein [Aliiroseovarius sp.]